MHLEGFQDVLFIITYGLAIVILSLLADRKNRNPLAWGLIGGLFFPCSLIYLACLPRLCPKCKDECKGRTCPNCDTVTASVMNYPPTRPLPNTLARVAPHSKVPAHGLACRL